MKADERSAQVARMLRSLGEEVRHGGFDEYPQFCEETLMKMIPLMSKKMHEYLMNEIENTSIKGIDRKGFK